MYFQLLSITDGEYLYDCSVTCNSYTLAFNIKYEAGYNLVISNILIGGNKIKVGSNTVSGCTCSTSVYDDNFSYIFNYDLSNGASAQDTISYTEYLTTNTATYGYSQTVSNDTLLYLDTLLLGFIAIVSDLINGYPPIDGYAGLVDLGMTGLYNVYNPPSST